MTAIRAQHPIMLTPIGIIETPDRTLEACSRNVQPVGLLNLTEHGRTPVLYRLDGVNRIRLVHRRRKDGIEMGAFAIRSPNRPNPIGGAVVKLLVVMGDEVMR